MPVYVHERSLYVCGDGAEVGLEREHQVTELILQLSLLALTLLQHRLETTNNHINISKEHMKDIQCSDECSFV